MFVGENVQPTHFFTLKQSFRVFHIDLFICLFISRRRRKEGAKNTLSVIA